MIMCDSTKYGKHGGFLSCLIGLNFDTSKSTESGGLGMHLHIPMSFLLGFYNDLLCGFFYSKCSVDMFRFTKVLIEPNGNSMNFQHWK